MGSRGKVTLSRQSCAYFKVQSSLIHFLLIFFMINQVTFKVIAQDRGQGSALSDGPTAQDNIADKFEKLLEIIKIEAETGTSLNGLLAIKTFAEIVANDLPPGESRRIILEKHFLQVINNLVDLNNSLARFGHRHISEELISQFFRSFAQISSMADIQAQSEKVNQKVLTATASLWTATTSDQGNLIAKFNESITKQLVTEVLAGLFSFRANIYDGLNLPAHYILRALDYRVQYERVPTNLELAGHSLQNEILIKYRSELIRMITEIKDKQPARSKRDQNFEAFVRDINGLLHKVYQQKQLASHYGEADDELFHLEQGTHLKNRFVDSLIQLEIDRSRQFANQKVEAFNVFKPNHNNPLEPKNFNAFRYSTKRDPTSRVDLAESPANELLKFNPKGFRIKVAKDASFTGILPSRNTSQTKILEALSYRYGPGLGLVGVPEQDNMSINQVIISPLRGAQKDEVAAISYFESLTRSILLPDTQKRQIALEAWSRFHQALVRQGVVFGSEAYRPLTYRDYVMAMTFALDVNFEDSEGKIQNFSNYYRGQSNHFAQQAKDAQYNLRQLAPFATTDSKSEQSSRGFIQFLKEGLPEGRQISARAIENFIQQYFSNSAKLLAHIAELSTDYPLENVKGALIHNDVGVAKVLAEDPTLVGSLALYTRASLLEKQSRTNYALIYGVVAVVLFVGTIATLGMGAPIAAAILGAAGFVFGVCSGIRGLRESARHQRAGNTTKYYLLASIESTRRTSIAQIEKSRWKMREKFAKAKSELYWAIFDFALAPLDAIAFVGALNKIGKLKALAAVDDLVDVAHTGRAVVEAAQPVPEVVQAARVVSEGGEQVLKVAGEGSEQVAKVVQIVEEVIKEVTEADVLLELSKFTDLLTENFPGLVADWKKFIEALEISAEAKLGVVSNLLEDSEKLRELIKTEQELAELVGRTIDETQALQNLITSQADVAGMFAEMGWAADKIKSVLNAHYLQNLNDYRRPLADNMGLVELIKKIIPVISGKKMSTVTKLDDLALTRANTYRQIAADDMTKGVLLMLEEGASEADIVLRITQELLKGVPEGGKVSIELLDSVSDALKTVGDLAEGELRKAQIANLTNILTPLFQNSQEIKSIIHADLLAEVKWLFEDAGRNAVNPERFRLLKTQMELLGDMADHRGAFRELMTNERQIRRMLVVYQVDMAQQGRIVQMVQQVYIHLKAQLKFKKTVWFKKSEIVAKILEMEHGAYLAKMNERILELATHLAAQGGTQLQTHLVSVLDKMFDTATSLPTELEGIRWALKTRQGSTAKSIQNGLRAMEDGFYRNCLR